MFMAKQLKTTIGLGVLAGITFYMSAAKAETQSMIVAGGCFWCVESDFEKVPGVLDVESGYIGGHTKNPTYGQVSGKHTGHFEAVIIKYDDTKTSLAALSDYYWKTIDPTDPNGQFCDKGAPYKTAMFYQSEKQKVVFDASLAKVEANKPFSAKIVTEILTAKTFYLAEDYHQDYYKKNPLRYHFYRSSCGRDNKIESLWGEVASKAYH